MSNELCRVIIISHVEKYRAISRGKTFAEVSKKLKRIEILYLSLFCAVMAVYHII